MSSYIEDIFGPVEPISIELPESADVEAPTEEELPEYNWEDFLDPNEVQDISEIYNSPVGEVRHVSEDVCKSVLASAAKKYSYLAETDLRNALEWDLNGFLEYATLGYSNDFDFDESYAQYLTSGHPYEQQASIVASALWVSGAPEISESSREVLVASAVSSPDSYASLHARTRLSQMIEAGKLSETTISYLANLITTN